MSLIDTKGLEPFADLLKEIYGDLAKPGVAQVGIALATVIGLLNTCLSPIKFLNEKTELNRQTNLKQLAKRFSEIPPEEIVEAPPEIAVPIAEKLGYVSNEQLRDLYIELLAKASTRDLNECAHPSFVNIINNLSPDEATLLNQLETENRSKFIFLEIKMSDSKKRTARHITSYYSEFEQNSILTFEKNAPAYISNLIGLGIFQVSDQPLKQPKNYKKLEDTVNAQWQDIIKELDEDISKYSKENRSLKFKKGHIYITEFGNLFINAVMPILPDVNGEGG